MKWTLSLLTILTAVGGTAWTAQPRCNSCDGNASSQHRKTGLLVRACDRLDRHSCGYGKTHHEMGCTGIRGEAIFVFGSCWQFFEEPCRKQTRNNYGDYRR